MSITLIPAKWLLFAIFSFTFGILSLVWTPLELVLEERLRMRPGLPPFDWWYNPPDVIQLKIYLFNITNAEKYLSGQDEKLSVEEVGPIVFREILTHSDAVFNDNDTLSYTVTSKLVWDPTLNSINLNTTLMYPNLAVLFTASIFWDASYLTKTLLNYGFGLAKSKIFVKKTIYEILYNNTDPFLDMAHIFMPSVALFKNIGLIPIIYPGYEHRLNVFMGEKFGHERFFLVDKLNGSISVPGRGPKCKDNIVNATNTIIYSQLTPKSRIIKFLNILLCRTIPLIFQEEVYKQGLKAYKFVIANDAYNRTQPPEDDCYKDIPTLPDGLTDLSSCWFSYPVVGSFPHFHDGDSILSTYVNGLKPNISKHRAYIVVEPITGAMLESRGNLQINLHIRPLKYFHKIFSRVSNTIIPAFILERTNDHIPNYMATGIYIVLLLPTIGMILSITMITFGLYCLWKLKKFLKKSRHRYTEATVTEEDSTLKQNMLSEPNKLDSDDNFE